MAQGNDGRSDVFSDGLQREGFPPSRSDTSSGAIHGSPSTNWHVMMDLACSSCGAPMEAHFTRGTLVACASPPRIYYRGKHLVLSPMQARIMFLLVQFGSVSFDDLALLSRVNSLQGIFVATTALRKRLPSGISIITRRGWGYVLKQLQ